MAPYLNPHQPLQGNKHDSEQFGGNGDREMERGSANAGLEKYAGVTKGWHRAIGGATMPIGVVA